LQALRLFSRNFYLTFAVNFTVYLIYYLTTILCVEYAISELGADIAEAGLAAGIFVFAGFAGRIIAGRLSLSLKNKTILYGGVFLSLISTLLYLMPVPIFVFVLIRFLHGVGFGLASNAASAIAAILFPLKHRGEGLGYYMLSVTLATAAGPFLGLYLAQITSYKNIFTLGMLLTLFALTAIYFIKAKENSSAPKHAGFSFADFFEKSAVPMGLLGAVIGLCYAGVLNFLSPYLKEINSISAGSYFYIVYAIFILLARPFIGRATDQKPHAVMIFLMLAFAVGMFIFSLASSPMMALISAAFIGIGYGSFISSAQAITIKAVQASRIAMATSTFLALFDIGMGAGSYLLGALLSVINYHMLYEILTLLILGCAGIYALFMRKSR